MIGRVCTSIQEDTDMALKAFEERILNDLLPAFCDDPHRSACGYDASGFRADFSGIDDLDAANFLKAMDAGLVSLVGRLHRAPQSHAGEQFFWTGDKATIPRPLTLWIEPIITIATLATLHFDLGWPRESLGTQSVDWAFDVATYVGADIANEHIACEVKKTVGETDRLVDRMRHFASLPADESFDGKEKNAYRKVKGLRARRAPFFWAVGPGGHGTAFKLTYDGDGLIAFDEVPLDALHYSATWPLRASTDC